MIERGSLVTWSKSKKPGRVWRVEVLTLAPESHSCILIRGASIVPAGEAMGREPRLARMADLAEVRQGGPERNALS